MTYEELKKKGFDVNLHYSINEVAILATSLDTFGGVEPIVTIAKFEPFNYRVCDYRDTMIDLEDWQEAVKLAHELAMTPLKERGNIIGHDWIKSAKKALQGILGRG